jgi:hypothetical protein
LCRHDNCFEHLTAATCRRRDISALLLRYHPISMIHPPDKSWMSTCEASSLVFSASPRESAVMPDESWFCVASVSVRALIVCMCWGGNGGSTAVVAQHRIQERCARTRRSDRSRLD